MNPPFETERICLEILVDFADRFGDIDCRIIDEELEVYAMSLFSAVKKQRAKYAP